MNKYEAQLNRKFIKLSWIFGRNMFPEKPKVERLNIFKPKKRTNSNIEVIQNGRFTIIIKG